MKTSLTIMLVLFAISANLHICAPAHHSCIQNSVSGFTLRDGSDGIELLITTVRNQRNYLPAQLCTWEIRMSELLGPKQLLLEPRAHPMSIRTLAAPTMSYACNTTLSARLSNSSFQAVWHDGTSMPKFPLIVPIENSSQVLFVNFETGNSTPAIACERLELSVRVAVTGYCGRNMLLRQSRCHVISDMTLELGDFNGTGARLAEFSSTEDVRNFVKLNDLRAEEYPYKQPLNLSSPVRVGVFRCPQSERAFYWRSSNGSCAAEAFNSTDPLGADVHRSPPSSPQCASVRVGPSGDLQLEFSDCREPMRSLLSFAETPGTGGDPCELRLPCEDGDTADDHGGPAGASTTAAVLLQDNRSTPLWEILFGALALVVISLLSASLTTYYWGSISGFAERFWNWCRDLFAGHGDGYLRADS